MDNEKISCQICGASMHQITHKHLKKHDMTLNQYQEMFPDAPTRSQASIERKSKGAKNANKHRKGVSRDRITKQKISQNRKGTTAWNKGISKTKEEKEHLSKKMKFNYQHGRITHWNLGNHHSEETKQKISNTLSSQQRSYNEESKAKRNKTLEQKRKGGWKHKSTIGFEQRLDENKTVDKFNDKDWLFEQHVTNKQTLASICCMLGLHWKNDQKMVKQQLNRFDIPVYHWAPASSCNQRSVEDFISSYCHFITKDRTLIKPLELDIVIPDKKIAIEYCGLYWHSNLFKHKNYHREKLKRCNNIGYRLITIFEDEWLDRKDQVKSTLRHILNATEQRSYARCTTIHEISSGERKDFLEKYHIQGDGSGKINIGLYEQNNLVAVGTFKQVKPNIWLLNRFATSHSVVGAFSKILNYFKKTYDFQEIQTFADLRWSEGDLYERTGFVFQYVTVPEYYYIIRNKRVHKFNYRRKHLPTLLENFDPSLSEIQNTELNNITRIYDCGKAKYVLYRN